MSVIQAAKVSDARRDRSQWLDSIDRRALSSAISLICGDPGLAEEAMQEALLRAWEKVRSEDASDDVESWPAWVLTVALNYTRNHFRRLGRERIALRKLASQMKPLQSDNSDRVAGAVDLVRAMSKLTRREREVVALHYRLDMSIGEIAEALGVHEGTVKTLLHRGRGRLSSLVKVQLPEGSRPPQDLDGTDAVARGRNA